LRLSRMALTWLARWFDWRHALAVVQPATLIRWHRQGFRLWWRSMPSDHGYRFLIHDRDRIFVAEPPGECTL
jgi:hypothetical protein